VKKKYDRTGQAIDDDIIRHMRIVCSITKARIQTYIQNTYFLLHFHGNGSYANAGLCYDTHELSVSFSMI
jgi:hypothetical protein